LGLEWGADVNDLIDTTEMYLRTIYDLEEEGVVPLRARIAERLEQSGPTVSQTVARMERDGLLMVAEDRHLELTKAGRARAISVMRKHRLAERLLVDVIGLEWEHVHNEACRWEHVMSEAVERKLVKLLGGPTTSPYGNPIPGLDDLGVDHVESAVDGELQRVDEIARNGGGRAVIRRIAEHVQLDPDLMTDLKEVGIVPGNEVEILSVVGANKPIEVRGQSGTAELTSSIAHAVMVTAK
jgi:DtxR family transcriptional regulator, Mn-dependent transcriptional regulator